MTKLPQIQLQSTLVKNKAVAGEPLNQKGSLQVALKDESAKSLPANIILILDCSGSMDGHPMELLDKAINKVSHKLRQGDLISIVEFGTEAKVLLQEYDKDRVFQGIPSLQDMGGTDYTAALERTLDMIKNKSTTRKLKGDEVHTVSKTALFFSDGQPNSTRPYLELVKDFKKHGFSLHAMGLGENVEAKKLLELAELGGGIYLHANTEDELESGLAQMLNLSQDIKYSLPELEISVFPTVKLSNLALVAPPRELANELGPGSHKVTLPDLQSGCDMQLVFDIFVSEPRQAGVTQDLVEWNMTNAQTETTRVLWENLQTVLLAPVSTRPAILTKIYEGLDAAKNGDTKLSTQIATQLATIPNNPLATSGSTMVTSVSKSGLSQGKMLSLLSKTTTNRDGLKTK